MTTHGTSAAERVGGSAQLSVAAQVGARVVVPGGRTGTVTGVKTVYVQLDGVGSRNSVDVDRLAAPPQCGCDTGFSGRATCATCRERGHWSCMSCQCREPHDQHVWDSEHCCYGPYKCQGVSA